MGMEYTGLVTNMFYFGVCRNELCCLVLLSEEHCLQPDILLPPANEVWGKVIFSEACVKNSVHSGGRGVQAHTGGGGSQHALRQTPPPADGYCCGRYASYWNAFLLNQLFKYVIIF